MIALDYFRERNPFTPILWFFAFIVACLWSGLLHFDFSPSGYNVKRVAQGGLLLMVFLMYLTPTIRRRINAVFERLPNPALVLIIFSLFFGAFSALFSTFVYKGLQEVGLYSLLLLCSVFLVVCGLAEQQLIKMMAVIGSGIGLYLFGYFFQYILYLEYPPKSWMYTIYQFSHPRTLNHTQNWLIPLLALLPLFSVRQPALIKKLSWLPVISMYFLMLVSGGRGIFLSLFVSLIVIASLFRGQINDYLKVHGIGFLIGFSGNLLLIQLIPVLLGHSVFSEQWERWGDPGTGYARLILWEKAYQIFMDNPWLGIGPQHYITAMGAGPGSPHNIIFQWFSEWGGFAALCLICLSAWGGVSYVRKITSNAIADKNQPENQVVSIAVLMALLSAGIHSQVSGVFITPMSQLLMVIVFGYCLNKCLPEKKVNDLTGKRLTSILCCGIFLLGMGFFIITGWEFFYSRDSIYLILESMAPRFWENGAFQR